MLETKESVGCVNTRVNDEPKKKRGAPYIAILTGQIGRIDIEGDWIVYHEQEFEVAGYDWGDLGRQIEKVKAEACQYTKFNEWEVYKPYVYINGSFYDQRDPSVCNQFASKSKSSGLSSYPDHLENEESWAEKCKRYENAGRNPGCGC